MSRGINIKDFDKTRNKEKRLIYKGGNTLTNPSQKKKVTVERLVVKKIAILLWKKGCKVKNTDMNFFESSNPSFEFSQQE